MAPDLSLLTSRPGVRKLLLPAVAVVAFLLFLVLTFPYDTLARRLESEAGEDLGMVGEVDTVNIDPITSILDQGRIPVVASIGLGYDGESYNVNADVVAAELAVALQATKLILLTDVDGVHGPDGGLISELDATTAEAYIASGVIEGGMIPKVRAALRALDGVEAAHIIDGRLPHGLLLELLTSAGVGTMFSGGLQAL